MAAPSFPATAPAHTYDLTPFRPIDRRRGRPVLRIMVAMAIIFPVVGFAVGLAANGGHLGVIEAVFTVTFLAGSAVPVLILVGIKPWRSDRILRIDGEGLQLERSNGEVRRATWSDPVFFVRMNSLPPEELALAGIHQPGWVFYSSGLRAAVFVGQDAATDLLERARARGLQFKDEIRTVPKGRTGTPVTSREITLTAPGTNSALPSWTSGGLTAPSAPTPVGSAPSVPGPGLPVSFDVSAIADQQWKRQGRLRTQSFLLIPFVLVIAIVELVDAFSFPVGSSHFLFLLGVVAGTVLLIAFMGFFLTARAFRRGPDRVELTVEGLRLVARSGPPVFVPWRGPTTRIQVSDYRDSMIPEVRAAPCAVTVQRNSFRVSTEAADGILGVAKERAGAVFLKQVSGFDGRPIPLWDIRGSPLATPPAGWTKAN